MRERLKRVVLKTTVRETVPGVRIPLPPPDDLRVQARTLRSMKLVHAADLQDSERIVCSEAFLRDSYAARN